MTGDVVSQRSRTLFMIVIFLLLLMVNALFPARELLLDAGATAFFLVMNPDKLSILESRKALKSLERAHVPLDVVIVNRVLPAEAQGDFMDRRRRQEAPYLRQIEAEFAHLPRAMLPLLPDDVTGLEALSRVGRVLTAGADTSR